MDHSVRSICINLCAHAARQSLPRRLVRSIYMEDLHRRRSIVPPRVRTARNPFLHFRHSNAAAAPVRGPFVVNENNNCRGDGGGLVVHNPGLSSLVQALTGEWVVMSTCSIAEIEIPFDSWSMVSEGSGKLLSFDFPKRYV